MSPTWIGIWTRARWQGKIGTGRVVLLNDLEATAYGLPWLKPEQLHALNTGKPRLHAAKALIAAGTGLGESLLHWDGRRYTVTPTEGGHCDFAPRTDQEIELLRYMKEIEEPVSFEMVLSGHGFQKLHEFLDATVRHAGFEDADDRPRSGDHPPRPGGFLPGLRARTAPVGFSLRSGSREPGAERAFARGACTSPEESHPRSCRSWPTARFLSAFCRKSKFSGLLAEIPVHVVLSEEAPLLGAAAEAARLP